MAAAAGGETRAGIGSRLRVAREKKGLTLLQTAEKLHVDSRIVEALEAEDFAALGAPVYARGHLRHYAELVDESAAELQALYAEATKAQSALPDLTRIARGEPMDDSRRLAGPVMIGVIAVAVIGSVWWVLNLSVDNAQRPRAHSAAASSSVTATAVAAADEDTNTAGQAGSEANNQATASKAGGGASSGPSPGSKAGAATAAARAGAAGSATVGGVQSPAVPANTVQQARVAAVTPASGTAAAVPNSTSRAKDKDGVLTLKFSSDSWAEVYDASGQRLFYDVGTASSAHTVKGPAPMRVVLGNASGVAVEYNGRPAPIPAGNQADGSARFVINAHGRAVPATATASNGD